MRYTIYNNSEENIRAHIDRVMRMHHDAYHKLAELSEGGGVSRARLAMRYEQLDQQSHLHFLFAELSRCRDKKNK